jgi:hypothetical protein
LSRNARKDSKELLPANNANNANKSASFHSRRLPLLAGKRFVAKCAKGLERAFARE